MRAVSKKLKLGNIKAYVHHSLVRQRVAHERNLSSLRFSLLRHVETFQIESERVNLNMKIVSAV